MSFLCSVMEAVLLSTPMTFLKVREKQGFRSASLFIGHKKKLDSSLSAILSMNTIANTFGAAGVGAQAVVVFGEAYFGVVSAVLTFMILIFSEIIPKTIGAFYWRKLSDFVAHSIRVTLILMYPLVMTSKFVTILFSKSKSSFTTSREEMSALANIGVDEGIIEENENIIIQNIIRLKDVRVFEIMTPRVVMAVADEDMKLSEFRESKNFLKFSRIPIYFEDIENITGYIIRQNVFEKLAENKGQITLKSISRNIEIVHESTPLFTVWELLLEKKEHIALVVDEYGGVAGIVTMEDIIESLLGFEIIDEKDTVTDMQQFARERWKMRQIKYNLLDTISDEDPSTD